MKNSVLENAAWIIVCKIGQSILNFIIGLITVRYLGPSNYGVISYVASIVAFALPFMQLGLSHTLVKEFIKKPDKEGEILGTALTINIISSIFAIFGCISFVLVANAGEKETIIVCILYSLTLLFQATEMTKYWFQSKLLSKYPSIASLFAYTIVAIYKIFLLVTEKSVFWFTFSNVIDYLVISFVLIYSYRKLNGQKLSFNWQLGKELLSQSKYYIIPSLMVMIFQHTDRIMIKIMIGEFETGLYSAAITCIGISGFVFSAIIESARPIILEAKEQDNGLFERRIINLYSIVTFMSFSQSIVMSIFSKEIVYLLFGNEYLRTADVLAIAVWYITFAYYGSVRNIWILAEGKQKHLTGINVVGAIANVLLNLLLIPKYGAIGAAIASLFTQFFTNVIIGFIFEPIRPNNQLMLKGLNPKVMVGIIQSVFKKIKVRVA